MNTNHSRLLISSVVALLLSACADNNNNNYTKVSDLGNITAISMTVVTPEPRISGSLKAIISLQSDQQTSDVSVSLFAIEKTDDPNSESRQIPLGMVVLDQVSIGRNDYELEVIIPASVEFAGPYYISAIVDPANVNDESIEDDNITEVEVTLGESEGPNILLADIALDRTALIINTDFYEQPVPDPDTTDNVYKADAGGTITVGVDGLVLGETVDVEVFASIRIMRSDIGTSLDMPLYLWNTAEVRYTNAYGIDPETSATVDVEWLPMGQFAPLLAETSDSEASQNEVRRNSEHMDFYFPGGLGYELEQALRYRCTELPCTAYDTLPTEPPPDLTATAILELKSFLSDLPFSGAQGDESAGMAVLDFEICVKIKPSDPMVSDKSTTDNEACAPIDIYLPRLPGQPPVYDIGTYTPQLTELSTPLNVGGGFSTNNTNSNFAFDIDFGSGASADHRGYIGYVSAGLPVGVFGNNFFFMNIEVSTQLVPDYLNKPASEESGFYYELRFLGLVLEQSPPAPYKPFVNFDVISHDLLTPNFISYSKEIEKEKQFFLWVVPVVAGGVIGGNIGLDYSVGFAGDASPVFGNGNSVESLGASIAPYANLEAGLSIGVGIKGGIVVGTEGVLTLLDERVVLFLGTDIEVIDDGYASGDVEFIITSGFSATNVFTGPQGAINLFIKYATFKRTTCKVGVVKYRCIKYDTMKRILNIYTTPALFQHKYVLFEYPISSRGVVMVSGKPPAYYTTP